MSEVLKRKVIYLTVNNKRYKFTETIELIHPTSTNEVIDLTQDETESSSHQAAADSTVQAAYNTPQPNRTPETPRYHSPFHWPNYSPISSTDSTSMHSPNISPNYSPNVSPNYSPNVSPNHSPSHPNFSPSNSI